MTYPGVPEPDKSKTPCCTASRPPSDIAQDDRPERVKQKETASTDGMVYLSENTFLMGTDYAKGFPQDGEGPIRKVRLDAFWIDRFAVTNSQFKEFVEHTGYETDAETYGWSFAFHLFLSPGSEKLVKGVAEGTPWWRGVEDASWWTLAGRRLTPGLTTSPTLTSSPPVSSDVFRILYRSPNLSS